MLIKQRVLGVGAVLILAMAFPGCPAFQSFLTSKATQEVIAEGCRAAAADDNMHNALLNKLGGSFPQLAAAVVGLNTAHMAIQAAYAECISKASAAANPTPNPMITPVPNPTS